MKQKIMRFAAFLVLLSFLSSCFHHIKTDRRHPGYHKYRRAGREW